MTEPRQPQGNILIVDDTRANLDVLSGILREQGYKVRPAPNGRLALKSIQVSRPDLILLDIRMPEMDGYEVCHRIKADDNLKDIPIIILSGIAKKTFMRSQKALTEFGGKEVPEPRVYLEKPVEPEVLTEEIKKILG